MSFLDLLEGKEDEFFGAVMSRYLSSAVYYIIDRDNRKSVHLSRWIRKQLDADSTPHLFDLYTKTKITGNSDQIMHSLLREIVRGENKVTYKSDYLKWKNIEKWQTAEETARDKTGDCEDGAILLYVLARLHGVSEHQLRIMAGYVLNPYSGKREGHAYLAYRPVSDPFHWVILDWCYLPDTRSIGSRKKYFFHKKTKNRIYEWNPKTRRYQASPIYEDIWWGFNEDDAIKDFTIRL